MIPIRLTLRNFMSYGAEPAVLPFEDLHVACLSGDNGNGKSALLDAITWALWGKTRASSVGSVSDDDLVRAGAEEAEVRFEFELNDQQYRVVRKRRRGKSTGGSDWQLTQRDAADNYVPIGGTSQRETGKLIIQLLNMEYETFLNSAYLQQGRADEFTRQTPARRKAILGEILGLERYDRLEVRARELYKERKEKADDINREIAMLEAAANRKPDHETHLVEVRVQRTVAEEALVAHEARVAGLRISLGRLDQVATSVDELRTGCKRLHADIAQREQERCAKLEHLQNIQDMLAQKQSILTDYEAYGEALRRRDKLEPEIEAFNKSFARSGECGRSH